MTTYSGDLYRDGQTRKNLPALNTLVNMPSNVNLGGFVGISDRKNKNGGVVRTEQYYNGQNGSTDDPTPEYRHASGYVRQ